MSALKPMLVLSVLSAPRLSVRSGGSARLLAGSGSAHRWRCHNERQGGTLQSVDYRQSGIIFDLSPQVFRDAVRLTP